MIAVRDATPGDYEAYAGMFPELGVDDPIPTRERFAAELVPRMLVATDAGTVAGYLLYEQMETTGYIRNVVTDPAHRRKGVGVALMHAARDRFAGALSWALNVKQENTAAIALYERFGLRTEYRTVVTRLLPSTALPPALPGLSAAELPSARDAEVEPLMTLLPGQLASARAKVGRHVIALVRGSDVHRDEVVGIAVMMSIGAFPFRLLDATHAATFMTFLRPMAAADAEFVQFSADNDEPLVAELLRLGCVPRMELFHMSGPLGQSGFHVVQ